VVYNFSHLKHIRNDHVVRRKRTIQPPSHSGVKGKVQSLDQDLIVLKVLLREHRVALEREGLSRDNKRLRALSQDNRLIRSVRHDVLFTRNRISHGFDGTNLYTAAGQFSKR